VDKAQYLDDSGVRQTQALRVLIIGFVIVMVDGYDSMMIAFLAPLLARDLALSPTDMGKIFAVGYLGAIVGAIATPQDRFKIYEAPEYGPYFSLNPLPISSC